MYSPLCRILETAQLDDINIAIILDSYPPKSRTPMHAVS